MDMVTIGTRLRKLLGEAPEHFFSEKIRSKPGYWGERILSQLVFAYELSKVEAGRFDTLIEAGLDRVENGINEEGVITKQTALDTEALLTDIASAAKSYEILCVAHAHIDMNWMWSWDETVSVTIDTFRTMLELMKQYPEFTFSQSQASIYRIVEQYAPAMLNEIKQRIREGRWEVTASHWVEADKNMPSGESLTRHILYTKKYLSQLLEIDPNQLNLDYEPDTFGHSENVPEILASGGVKYYYHCRGADEHILYRWEAPSGQSVIAYREPTWYNDHIQPILGAYVPDICRRTGLKTHLNVYGVGDHGGGPTRRDLDRMMDMKLWPIYPNIRFGTYREYFQLAESLREQLPIVKGEQNFVFTGCYTSQTRIKTANRIGEATLNEAEAFSAIAGAATGLGYPGEAFEDAWRNVLFNQFHDILPGSGVIETREHASGLFQHTMAVANTNRKLALESIAAAIDTSGLAAPEELALTTSEGAGVGFGTSSFKITQVERGGGSTRIVHVFNSSAHDRGEAVEFILWDWRTPVRSIVVKDSKGQTVHHQVLDHGFNQYWGHHFIKLLIDARVAACGYETYTVTEGEDDAAPILPADPRVDKVEQYVLENEHIKATFDPVRAALISLIHKASGEELVSAERPSSVFRLIREDDSKGMTAWWVGRYMDITEVHNHVKIKNLTIGPVRQSFQYEMAFASSKLSVIVSLDRNSTQLDYEVKCDWQEIGRKDEGIPQLQFYFPFAYDCTAYRYDVPFGTVVRKALDMDVPANSWTHVIRESAHKPSVMLTTNNKYGFRGIDNAISLSLIRSSFDPDPYPELGNHHNTRFSIGIVEPASTNAHLIEKAYLTNHPMSVLSGSAHSGTRPLDAGFLKLAEGSVAISALKMPEKRIQGTSRWIVRSYETEGNATVARLELFQPISSAYFVDANEEKLAEQGGIQLEGNIVTFEVQAYASAAICLELTESR